MKSNCRGLINVATSLFILGHVIESCLIFLVKWKNFLPKEVVSFLFVEAVHLDYE